MTGQTAFEIGDRVTWIVLGGTIHGKVEEISDKGDIGVRLENNNFKWLPPSDLAIRFKGPAQ